MMKAFLFIGIALAFFLLTTPQKAVAEVELGLTPSNVYGLWTNINAALVALAESTVEDEVELTRILQIEPNKFFGKTPKNVLAKVTAFNKKLHVLAKDKSEHGAEKTFADEVLFILKEDEGVVTPSLVYMRSGHVLAGVVKLVSDRYKTPQPIGPFFIRHNFRDKTPSDVFALVDLASRRYEAIEAKVAGHGFPARERRP